MSLFKFNLNINPNRPSNRSELPLQTRAIQLLNLFRLIISLSLIGLYFYIGNNNWWDRENEPLFLYLSMGYFAFSTIVLIIDSFKLIVSSFLQTLQFVADIIFIVLLMSAAGGISSGLGLLLIITIVIASLISNGRLALFYAAIATIGLLLEQTYQIMRWDLTATSYTQSVMLSVSCFATAWLAYSLAKRMQQSEALASARGIDLENMEQVNALITQEMHDGIIVVDQDFIIRHTNLQADVLLGLSSHSETIILKTLLPQIEAKLGLWIAGDDHQNNTIITINDQELKFRFMPINRLRNQGAVIFIQDWSQIQSAAQQTKLAALGRLTANIAHEIRNPLSAISHATQLLQEDNTAAPTVRVLEIISDNIQRIDQIIKDVLELNRRDRTHQDSIDLNPFLTEFHAQFCAVEKIPVSHFNLTLSLHKPTIIFDHRHLTQILWNLSKNGWEHSQKSATSLSLHSFSKGHQLYIEIRDDGEGVAEHERSRLFEPFFTTKKTGNGLGLYISRELAEANGANIQYQSLSPGSAFVLHIKKSG
jgi:two-component system sensor histidine kinase PilS (NtrC family)